MLVRPVCLGNRVNGLPSGQARGGASPLAPRQAARGPPSIRRQFLRAARELDALGYVPWWRARTLCAYWGQLKYTDSIHFCQTYDAYRIFKAARRSVAWKARKEAQRGAVCQAAG